MKLLTYLLFAALPFTIKAEDGTLKSRIPYEIVKTTVDKTLKKTEAVFDFVFVDRNNQPIQGPVKYAYNGKNATMAANKTGKHAQKLAPGKYKFQFFYNEKYAEVYTDSIEIKPANRIELKIYFERADIMQIADKPVIYLYPQKTTEVQVQVNIKGDFIFTYPQYEQGWTVTADADGTLHQGNKTFKYLFWEGQTEVPAVKGTLQGFVKSTADLTGFFEEKLSQMGLNGTEMQDFITYWVPRMQQFPKHLIRFVCNNEYNQIAGLTVTPKPDHMIRVFMVWEPLSEGQNITVMEQTLPTFARAGFTLVEWGGMEVKNEIRNTKSEKDTNF